MRKSPHVPSIINLKKDKRCLLALSLFFLGAIQAHGQEKRPNNFSISGGMGLFWVLRTMKRAIDTASVIADRCDVSHSIAADLHERQVGKLGGTSFALAEGPWVETVRRWSNGEIEFTTPGAESYAELMARLVPAFERAIEPFAGGRVVVIAHGIVCKILLLTFLEGWGPRKWEELGKVSNLAVSEVERSTSPIWEVKKLLYVPPHVAHVDENRKKFS